MSKLLLYPQEEKAFQTNGLGFLADTTKAEITEELNGEYELYFEMPAYSKMAKHLDYRNCVLTRTAQDSAPQIFRIYRLNKGIDGRIRAYAAHISYDLNGAVIQPFRSTRVDDALLKMQNGMVPDTGLSLLTDMKTEGFMWMQVPVSARKAMGGIRGSIRDVYGGDWQFSGLNAILTERRGKDRGVILRYGKNLMDLTQEQNCSEVYTGVYPFWQGGETGEILVTLPEKVVKAAGSFPFERYKAVDFSADFLEAPTFDKLRSRAEKYVADNRIGIPDVNLRIKYASADNTTDYKGRLVTEQIFLGDTVHVYYPEIGVKASARCTKTVYNVLLNRMEAVEIGKPRASIVDTLAK